MNWRATLDPARLKQILDTPRVRKTGMAVLGMFAACVIALFFAWPPLLKAYLAGSLSKQLGRSISVGAIHVNPLMLSVAIDDFVLAERDGKTPAFKQLYVNAQLASIVMGGPVLSEIRLTGPRVRLVRGRDERYNFQDILDRMAKPGARTCSSTPASGGWPWSAARSILCGATRRRSTVPS